MITLLHFGQRLQQVILETYDPKDFEEAGEMVRIHVEARAAVTRFETFERRKEQGIILAPPCLHGANDNMNDAESDKGGEEPDSPPRRGERAHAKAIEKDGSESEVKVGAGVVRRGRSEGADNDIADEDGARGKTQRICVHFARS